MPYRVTPAAPAITDTSMASGAIRTAPTAQLRPPAWVSVNRALCIPLAVSMSASFSDTAAFSDSLVKAIGSRRSFWGGFGFGLEVGVYLLAAEVCDRPAQLCHKR